MRPVETETAGWVEEVVPMDGEAIAIRRPRDFEDLLTEEAFVQEELLPYWAHLWPSAVALAEELAPRSLRGARTLELGCGLGLPSVVAARGGGGGDGARRVAPAVA
jgi:predicted nicotinamide N-methyase